MEVQKFGYWTPVNVVDGVPQCSCHQEPMVGAYGGTWQCATGKAITDYLAFSVEPLMESLGLPAT